MKNIKKDHSSFAEDLQKIFDRYYHITLSESIKRGLAAKKQKLLHKKANCNVKKCKA